MPERRSMEVPRVGFAPVAPIHLLEQMWFKEPTLCGHYHLWLAHDVLEPDKSSRFRKLSQAMFTLWGARVTIHMDNSIIELGNAVDMETVMRAAKLVGATTAILPDVMGNGDASIEMFHKAMSQLHKIADWHDIELMAVPQGPTVKDFMACVEAYLKFPDVQWIGIPRIAVSQLGSRYELMQRIRSRAPKHRLHLLGFSDNVADDIYCAAEGIAEGIDSAVPVRAGQDNIEFKLSRNDYGKRGTYWTRPQPLTGQAISNINNVRSLINAHRPIDLLEARA